jgi:ABC-type histidine transport system ATPase subunit
MAQVGWQVHQLTNGYKAYRNEVLLQIPLLSEKCDIRIVSAPTGSGTCIVHRCIDVYKTGIDWNMNVECSSIGLFLWNEGMTVVLIDVKKQQDFLIIKSYMYFFYDYSTLSLI